MNLYDIVTPMTMDEAKATKTRLDKTCWKGKKIGKPATKVKGGVRVNNCVPKESIEEDNFHGLQDDWHAGNNAWSSDNHEMFEGHSFSNGDQVELKPEYADRAGEVYTVSQCDVERGRCWIGDADGRGWYARFDQLIPAVEQDDVEEGWSNKMVARRTGQLPTPYSVYIKGEKWRDFADDDHAENVANKLRAKFEREGRDPSVITIAATNKDIKETEVDEHIGKVKDGYRLYSSKGKNLGTFPSKAGAEKHEREVQYFKHAKEGVAEGTGPQSKLDQKIIHLLTNGIPADAIARKLDIPVAWVDEVAEYNMPDSAIDYNDPRNTPPTNRFGEGVAEVYTPAPAKPFRNPPGFNKQGTGMGNKLADLNRAELANIQPSKGTPVPGKEFAQGVLKDLKKVNVKESYWTKLQNERNTKLNSLVNELKESIKK